jgi:hypothetical protein
MPRTLITLAIIAAPRAALACPVCFGQNDSPMAWGVYMGIVAMLAVTGGVLFGFASFFLYLVRRTRMAAGEVHAPGSPAEAGRYVLRGSDPQEGTAQC